MASSTTLKTPNGLIFTAILCFAASVGLTLCGLVGFAFRDLNVLIPGILFLVFQALALYAGRGRTAFREPTAHRLRTLRDTFGLSSAGAGAMTLALVGYLVAQGKPGTLETFMFGALLFWSLLSAVAVMLMYRAVSIQQEIEDAQPEHGAREQG